MSAADTTYDEAHLDGGGGATPRRTSVSTERYLQLLKEVLSYSLWEEPGVPIGAFRVPRSRLRELLIAGVSGALRRRHLQLVRLPVATAEQRRIGRVHPLMAETMIGLPRLDNIQNCVEQVIAEHVPGDLIETGVWRGGATIFMRAVLAAYGVTDRRVFVADSFAGLPKPDEHTYSQDRGDQHHTFTHLAVSKDDVARNFEKYGLLDDQVVFLEGWFKDTLPSAPIDKLAVMRLDGDMYQSTIEALEALYPKLSPGGFCIIDDYELEGCRGAVDDFRASQGITEALIEIDWTGVFWRRAQY
ncbi:MAG: TylF/MycF family methyltransferase [Acidimicrobiales bacterium]